MDIIEYILIIFVLVVALLAATFAFAVYKKKHDKLIEECSQLALNATRFQREFDVLRKSIDSEMNALQEEQQENEKLRKEVASLRGRLSRKGTGTKGSKKKGIKDGNKIR